MGKNFCQAILPGDDTGLWEGRVRVCVLLFLKTQLKWHLFQEDFCSILAKSMAPPLLSECLYLDESRYAASDDNRFACGPLLAGSGILFL